VHVSLVLLVLSVSVLIVTALRLEVSMPTLTRAPLSPEERRKQLISQFRSYDISRDGYLSYQEMLALLRRGNPSMTSRELDILFKQIDKSGDGRISFEEFVGYLTKPVKVPASAVRVSPARGTRDTRGRDPQPAHAVRVDRSHGRSSRAPAQPDHTQPHGRSSRAPTQPDHAQPREVAPKDAELRLSPEDRGRAPKGDAGDYTWIRKANEEVHRNARRQISSQTWRAIQQRGYFLSSQRITLHRVEEMTSRTCLVGPGFSDGFSQVPPSKGKRAGHLVVERDVVLAIAEARCVEGRRVAAVQAASAFHAGGGFATGGRHALEEAFCVQTTLYASLQVGAKLASEAHVVPPEWVRPKKRSDGKDWEQHVPDNGCLLSPHVEIFRDGTNSGYAFKDKAVTLEAVISVAMPNCNNRMRDSPVDAAPTDEAYRKQLEAKWRAVLTAASCYTQADCLVVPDAGCGVFRNPPEEVGSVLGHLLKTEFAGCFEEVVIAFPGGKGGERFADAAMAAHSPETPSLRRTGCLQSLDDFQGSSDEESNEDMSANDKSGTWSGWMWGN